MVNTTISFSLHLLSPAGSQWRCQPHGHRSGRRASRPQRATETTSTRTVGEINVDFNILPLDCKTSESTELLFAKLYIKAK